MVVILVLYVTDKSFQHSASSPAKAEWRLLLSAWLPELKELMRPLDSTQDMSTISCQDREVSRWWCLSVCLCLSFSLWPFSSLTSICQLSNYLYFLQGKDSYIMTLSRFCPSHQLWALSLGATFSLIIAKTKAKGSMNNSPKLCFQRQSLLVERGGKDRLMGGAVLGVRRNAFWHSMHSKVTIANNIH